MGQYCHPNSPAGGGGPGKFVSPTILGFDGLASDSRFHPLSPASRYLTAQDYQKHFEGGNFNIEKIPGLMSSKGWPMGAALMSSWFARSPRIAPDYDTPGVALVSVDWILKFDRAKSVYDKIISERLWRNSAAINAIKGMLKSKGLLKLEVGKSASFGDFTRTALELHQDHVNHRLVDYSVIFDDDMDAALGNFSFYILIKGSVRRQKGSSVELTINSIGIYIKDSYDFNDEQLLGYWSEDDYNISTRNIFKGVKVSNADFRRWRDIHLHGGDFLILSDIKEVHLPVPDIFPIP